MLSFALALSRKRSLIGAIGAGLAFGMAALTKETTLVLAPVLLYLLVHELRPAQPLARAGDVTADSARC